MIKAKHHIVVYPMFQWLTRFLLKRKFSSVQIHGDFNDNRFPVLVISNHVSWWDGFWVIYLNLQVLKRKFYFMMLEEQLKKHWYFKYTGGYSVKLGSRSIVESINYTIDLLHEKGNMVFMFPQGKIHSSYNRNIKFGKGVDRIVQNCPPETQVLFMANLTDYFSNPKPGLYINLKSFTAGELKSLHIEKEYNAFYHQCAEKQGEVFS